MRHYTAAQKGDGPGWHYVSLGRTGGYPLGYCADHEPHPTEAEARECYARWQRDHVRLGSKWSWTSCDMPDCPKPANRGAKIEGDGYHLATLCDEHLTVENAVIAMGLDQPAGDSWIS